MERGVEKVDVVVPSQATEPFMDANGLLSAALSCASGSRPVATSTRYVLGALCTSLELILML